MKKMQKKLLASAVAFSALAAVALTPVAHAEVSASVGAANMYYWRGLDLGNGDPQIWGDINYSASGFYAGVWAGSGDSALGQEYDLYLGYGGEVGDFSYGVSLWSYAYPSAPYEYDEDDEIIGGGPVSPGDLVEVVGTIGYGPITFTYHEGLEDLEDYNYMTLAAAFGAFTVKYGVHEDDLAHVDLSYAFNDNLSFTLGQVVDDVDGTYNDELKFIVGFALPIE